MEVPCGRGNCARWRPGVGTPVCRWGASGAKPETQKPRNLWLQCRGGFRPPRKWLNGRSGVRISPTRRCARARAWLGWKSRFLRSARTADLRNDNFGVLQPAGGVNAAPTGTKQKSKVHRQECLCYYLRRAVARKRVRGSDGKADSPICGVRGTPSESRHRTSLRSE